MSRRRTKGPIMPYWRAMKAYAYAGKSFEYTLHRLSRMHFETPRPDKVEHLPYLRKYRAVFTGFRVQALRKSKTLKFTSSEIERLGIDPLYTWIRGGEKGSSNDKAAFVQSVIDDLAFTRLRKLVSIGFRLGQPPKEIQALLRRRSPVAWKAYHIDFYRRFFWNVTEMSEEALQEYLAIATELRFYDGFDYMKKKPVLEGRFGGPYNREERNEHYTYLKKVLSPGTEEQLRFERYLHYDVVKPPTLSDITHCIEDQLRKAGRVANAAQIVRFGSMYLRLRRMLKRGDALFSSPDLIIKATELIRNHGLPLEGVKKPGWYKTEKPLTGIACNIYKIPYATFSRYKGASSTFGNLYVIMMKLLMLRPQNFEFERNNRVHNCSFNQTDGRGSQ